jgi:hypothetical protein
MKITLIQYYSAFVSLYGAIAAIPFLPLLFHIFLPDSAAAAEYLYPPLGDFEQLSLTLTFLILVFLTYVVFESMGRMRIKYRVLINLAGAVVGVCALIVLYTLFVRRVPVPSTSQTVTVSVGYERTTLANRVYAGWSDWDMLHDRGPWEEQIHQLWTGRSIAIVRLLLWSSYTLTLSCLLTIVCFAVYKHARELVPNDSERPGKDVN